MNKEKFFVKEGHEEEFQKDMEAARGYFKGDRPDMVKIIFGMKMDRMLIPGVKKRLSRKRQIKQLLKEIKGDYIRRVFRHFKGFDDEGYRL